jgi:hypothetical protein
LCAEAQSVIGNVTRYDRNSAFADLIKVISPLRPELVKSVIAEDFSFNSALRAVATGWSDKKNKVTVWRAAQEPFYQGCAQKTGAACYRYPFARKGLTDHINSSSRKLTKW